jgi:hypothetical protein
MNRAQSAIWISTLAPVAVVNAAGALPRFHKGAQQPVGNDLVSVYSATGQTNVPSVPVLERRENLELAESGRVVQVYLATNYKDDQIVWHPRLTMCILAVGLITSLLFALISKLKRGAT